MQQLQQLEALYNLGVIAYQKGQYDIAVSYFQQAVALTPNEPKCYYNLATMLIRQNQQEEALEHLQKALEIDPNYADAHYNLACLYKLRFDWDKAIAHFEKAIALKPNNYKAYCHLAETLLDLNMTEAGIANYEKALAIDDSDDGLKIKLATAVPRIYQSAGDIQLWRNRAIHNINNLRADCQKHPFQFKKLSLAAGTTHFYWAYQGLDDKVLQQSFSRLFPADKNQSRRILLPLTGKIKIGFISSYFTDGHTIHKVFAGILDHLSREKFDVTVFTIQSAILPEIRLPYSHIDLVEDVQKACTAIQAENLDILFYTDIGMDSLTWFLAHYRLAPLQFATWGHPVTTGVETIDYYISSRLFEPEDAQSHYSEKLILMETIPAYFYRPQKPEITYPRGHFGLSKQDHVYLCPQSLFKFHPDFDSILCQILEQDPQGKLVLVNALHSAWNQPLMRRFETTMPNVVQQIRILDKLSHPEFLSLVSMADVMLDTIHFNGGRSTYESLAMGAPLVTLPSSFMRGRMTYGLYRKMNMAECIAKSTEDYIQIALKLGTQPKFQKSIREKIIVANHVLYEDIAAVRELESILFQTIRSL